MTINSLDRLRNAIVLDHHAGPDQSELSDLFNDVECEIDSNYFLLPKDMNGVPIHVGDKVCTKLGSTYTVARITREDYEGTTTWYIEDFASHYSLGSEDLTICKPPTVEDVLEKALNKAARLDRKEGYWPSAADITNIVNEIAPKLQLRKEE